jgi:hypothetical protein
MDPGHRRSRSNGAHDRRDDREHGQAPTAEPAGDPPGNEEDERTQGAVDPQGCQEVRLPRELSLPPPDPLAEGDNCEPHRIRGRRAESVMGQVWTLEEAAELVASL